MGGSARENMEAWRNSVGQNCGRPGMVSKGNFF